MNIDAGAARAAPVISSRSFARRVLHKPAGAISAGFLVLLVLACSFAPLIAPYGPLTQNLTDINAGPSAAHLLGTDELGRDVLSRVLYGGQVTILGVAECLVVILVISLPLGLWAGYAGGWIDRAVSAVVDLMLSIPSIIVILAVLAVFGSNMTVAMVTFGILSSAGVIRVVRSAVLSVREELYVAAARVSGVGRLRIVGRHILPRIAGPVIVQATLLSAITLGIQTGLAFLSLGVTPPAPSWGGMVAEAADLINQNPWLMVPSGGVIAVTVLALGLFGDAVRDATVERWSRPSTPSRRRRRPARDPGPAGARPAPAPSGAPAPPGVLAVENLGVEFDGPAGTVKVVEDVSFGLGEGEVLGIVGESGCGKSVTALALLGLLPGNGRIRGGRVMFEGEDLTGLPVRQLRQVRGAKIAMVFQDPMVSLDPSFRVGSQIAEVVRRHEDLSRARARARVLELLAQVRLPDPAAVARRYPHQLSGGMAQRVCIALALAGRPRVLIADEPTTALDVTVQAEILALLRAIRTENGMSVILVTHDWGVVADSCDRAIVMYAGQVVEHATVGGLFAAPCHPYTRGLQECIPGGDHDSAELLAIPGSVPPPASWPVSCRFRERCRYATPECAAAPIPLLHTGPGRDVRCIHWDTLAAVTTAGAGAP